MMLRLTAKGRAYARALCGEGPQTHRGCASAATLVRRTWCRGGRKARSAQRRLDRLLSLGAK